MKAALVNPPTKYVVTPSVYPPVGLGYVAAYWKQQHPQWQVDVLDCAGDTLEQAAAKLKGYSQIGFTATSTYWKDTVELARLVRRQNRFAVLIIGGPHVTLTYDSDPVFDQIFRGTIDFGGVDNMPIPQVPLGKNVNIGSAAQTAIIYTSFGCTHHCAFCAARGMYPKLEFRSIPHVLKEITHYMDRGIRDFRFMDDALTIKRARTLELCKALEPLGIRWGCMVRTDQVDPEVLAAMKQAGCVEAAYGIESFDQTVLDAIWKGTTVEQNIRAIRETDAAGISTEVFVMVGTPGETPRTIDLNIDGLERLRPVISKVLLQTFMPLPGCPVEHHPSAFGVEIVDTDWSKYNAHQFMSDGKGGATETPIWSPIRIGGMTKEQQYANHRRMRDYVIGLPHSNKGLYKCSSP